MKYASTKSYGHEVGLSCCFRQWRSESHCALLHGYAIAVRLEFHAEDLDDKNWVIDFGGLKEVKELLQLTFDHTLLVAADDPELDELLKLEDLNLAKVHIFDNVGCEAFTHIIYNMIDKWLKKTQQNNRVKLYSVEVKEHGANSAILYAD